MSMSTAGGVNRLLLAALYPLRYHAYQTAPPARKPAAIYVLSEEPPAHVRSRSDQA
jgi:hypothetical protein